MYACMLSYGFVALVHTLGYHRIKQNGIEHLGWDDGHAELLRVQVHSLVALAAPRACADGGGVPLRVARHSHVYHLLQQVHGQLVVSQVHARPQPSGERVLGTGGEGGVGTTNGAVKLS